MALKSAGEWQNTWRSDMGFSRRCSAVSYFLPIRVPRYTVRVSKDTPSAPPRKDLIGTRWHQS